MQIFCLQKAGMERHERLRLARERHFANMKEAAESLGVPYGTYSGHEKGSRGFKIDELLLYARRFHVSRSWLAFGDGDMDETTNAGTSLSLVRRPKDDGSATTADTPRQHDRVYIQVELSSLRELLRGAFQNENIPEEQADEYADAVCVCLTKRATSSLVLRLMDESRSGAVYPAQEAADRS